MVTFNYIIAIAKNVSSVMVRRLWTCSYIEASVVDIGKIEKNKFLLRHDQVFSKAGGNTGCF